MHNKNIWFMGAFRFPIICTKNGKISILLATISLDFALEKQWYEMFWIVNNSE